MATIHGKNAIVYLQGSGSDAVVITEAADWSLDIDYALEQDNAFGDTWETMVQGLLKYSGQIAGNYDTTQSTIFDAISAGSARKLYLYADRAATGRYYYGTVWPKLSPTMPIALAKFTTAFVGDGQLALK